MSGMLTKQKDEMEQALFHLMYQFRQIDQKYDLMMKEELQTLYQKRAQSIHLSKKWIDQQKVYR
jgi:glutamate dehydrogenase/leucine dehydrogenase